MLRGGFYKRNLGGQILSNPQSDSAICESFGVQKTVFPRARLSLCNQLEIACRMTAFMRCQYIKSRYKTYKSKGRVYIQTVFPTCQVRVVRFYQSSSPLLLLLSSFTAAPQLQVPDHSGHYRTSTLNSQPHNITTNIQYVHTTTNKARPQYINKHKAQATNTQPQHATITSTKSGTHSYKHTSKIENHRTHDHGNMLLTLA